MLYKDQRENLQSIDKCISLELFPFVIFVFLLSYFPLFFLVCPAGTFGNNCLQKCTWCDHGQFCDHITGQCLAITCPPGFTGHTCQKGNSTTI